MSTRTQTPRLWDAFQGLIGTWSRRRHGQTRPPRTQDALRAQRDLVQEMIWTNPEAFSHELDVQQMMHMYPGRF